MENAWRRADGSFPAVGVITNVDPINGTGTDVEGVSVFWQGELPMNTNQGGGLGQNVPEGSIHSIVTKIAEDVAAIKAKLQA